MKRDLYSRIKRKANKVTDANGCEIDSEIKELVVLLNCMGIKTVSSCQGHLEYGYRYHWIDFEFNVKSNKKMNSLLRYCFKDARPYEIDCLYDCNGKSLIGRLQPIVKTDIRKSNENKKKFEQFLKNKYRKI
jgi:hypothetical protein